MPATAVRSVVYCLGNVGLDTMLDGKRLARVLADDEDGVIAGDGADHLGPLFVIDGGSHRLRTAGAGNDDDEVERLAGFEAKVLQHLVDRGLVILVFVVAVVGKRISVGAFGELELVHITRKRGLGDVVTLGGEFAAQFLLVGDAAGDGGLRQEVADCVVPIALQNSPRTKSKSVTQMPSRVVHKHSIYMYKYSEEFRQVARKICGKSVRKLHKLSSGV